VTRFLRVREGLEPPAYARCRATPVSLRDLTSASDADLEDVHRDAVQVTRKRQDGSGAVSAEASAHYQNTGAPTFLSARPAAHSRGTADATAAHPSLLDLKIELARRELENCRLCPQMCGVDRTAGELGFCGVGKEAHVASHVVHLGEVPDLVPAFSVFLSGCTMKCIYCRKHDLIENPRGGRVLEPAWFAEVVAQGREEGARTLKLLGGTPEPHVAALLECLREVEVPLPVVWESTMYISERALDLIEGTVDLFIANLRYGNDDCARELSGVDAYVEPALAAVERAREFADVTIRHLVLPGHVDCCTGPLAEMLEEVAPEIEMVLLFQYVPFWRALEHPQLSRRLTEEERRHAVEVVSERKQRWSVAALA